MMGEHIERASDAGATGGDVRGADATEHGLSVRDEILAITGSPEETARAVTSAVMTIRTMGEELSEITWKHHEIIRANFFYPSPDELPETVDPLEYGRELRHVVELYTSATASMQIVADAVEGLRDDALVDLITHVMAQGQLGDGAKSPIDPTFDLRYSVLRGPKTLLEQRGVILDSIAFGGKTAVVAPEEWLQMFRDIEASAEQLRQIKRRLEPLVENDLYTASHKVVIREENARARSKKTT